MTQECGKKGVNVFDYLPDKKALFESQVLDKRTLFIFIFQKKINYGNTILCAKRLSIGTLIICTQTLAFVFVT